MKWRSTTVAVRAQGVHADALVRGAGGGGAQRVERAALAEVPAAGDEALAAPELPAPAAAEPARRQRLDRVVVLGNVLL